MITYYFSFLNLNIITQLAGKWWIERIKLAVWNFHCSKQQKVKWISKQWILNAKHLGYQLREMSMSAVLPWRFYLLDILDLVMFYENLRNLLWNFTSCTSKIIGFSRARGELGISPSPPKGMPMENGAVPATVSVITLSGISNRIFFSNIQRYSSFNIYYIFHETLVSKF